MPNCGIHHLFWNTNIGFNSISLALYLPFVRTILRNLDWPGCPSSQTCTLNFWRNPGIHQIFEACPEEKVDSKVGWFGKSSSYWLVLEIEELDGIRHLPGSVQCLQIDLLHNSCLPKKVNRGEVGLKSWKVGLLNRKVVTPAFSGMEFAGFIYFFKYIVIRLLVSCWLSTQLKPIISYPVAFIKEA